MGKNNTRRKHTEAKIRGHLKSRFETLQTLLADDLPYKGAKPPKDNLSTETLDKLITDYKAFAKDYYDYLESFGEEITIGQLNGAVGRLQEEWANISRAYEQRQTPFFKHFLYDAERVANDYYARFLGEKHNSGTLVYFEKLFAITRYVFTTTPCAMISLPLQLYNKGAEWQPLAHELGHHIYWNSLDLDKYHPTHKKLRSQLLKLLVPKSTFEDYEDFKQQARITEVWSFWLEETFADICGTLMAGVSYAQSAQQLAWQMLPSFPTGEEKTEGAFGEHPTSIIRPYIALETLAWVAQQKELRTAYPDQISQLENKISALRTRWDEIIEGFDNRYTIHEVGIFQLRDTLPIVVNAILEFEWDGNTPLGRLFDYSHENNSWLILLPTVEHALDLDETHIALAEVENKMREDTLMFQDELRERIIKAAEDANRKRKQHGKAFNMLLDILRGHLQDQIRMKGLNLEAADYEKELLKRLLNLDLGDEWREACNRYYNPQTGTSTANCA